MVVQSTTIIAAAPAKPYPAGQRNVLLMGRHWHKVPLLDHERLGEPIYVGEASSRGAMARCEVDGVSADNWERVSRT